MTVSIHRVTSVRPVELGSDQVQVSCACGWHHTGTRAQAMTEHQHHVEVEAGSGRVPIRPSTTRERAQDLARDRIIQQVEAVLPGMSAGERAVWLNALVYSINLLRTGALS